MKKILILVSLLAIGSCSAPILTQDKDICFLLYNMKTEKFEDVVGGARCDKRNSPCSTFKIPLALMSFDAKILRDENTLFLWDGQESNMVSSWNKDHTAASWMKESVIWYSQEVAKIMGKPKMQNYLNKFEYGNKDFSGDQEWAWLTPAPFIRKKFAPSIQISAYEQIEFLKKLWTNKLPVSPHALEVTKKITYLETSKNGYTLHGKTGSGFIGENAEYGLGWFVAHVEGHGKEYLAVYTFNDLHPQKERAFSGMISKESMKKILEKKDLW